MARKENLFLWFSTMVFAVASVFFAWHFFHQKNDSFNCSGNLAIYHDNTAQPILRGKFYLSLEPEGKGNIRMDGESLSADGPEILHRFIFFNYQSVHASVGMDFILDDYHIVLAPADTAGDKEFMSLINMISHGSEQLRIRIRTINPRTSLISSVSSPFLVCTSQ